MPADSRTLADEGVVIPPAPARRRRDRASSPRQMRNPRQRAADLRAQLAASRAGAERLRELLERFGADGLRAAHGARRSTTPSAARAPASPSSTDGDARGDATCSRRADGDLELRAARDRRRATS